MNKVAENITPKFGSYSEYVEAISLYTAEMSNLSKEDLLREVESLYFHTGSTAEYICGLVINKSDIIYVTFNMEKDAYYSIFIAYLDEESNICYNSYILWNRPENFKPWQNAEVFCRAYAALQNLDRRFHGPIYIKKENVRYR